MRFRNALAAARNVFRSSPSNPGEYSVGRHSVDVSLGEGERVQLELLYPAPPQARGEPVPLFSDALRQAMHEHLRVPLAALPKKEATPGQRGVPLAIEGAPLVLFLHGFSSFALQNRRQLEGLASRGFVCAAISFPGDSLVTEHADGTIVPIDVDEPAFVAQRGFDRASLPGLASRIQEVLGGLRRAESPQALAGALDALLSVGPFGLYVPVAERMARRTTALLERLPTLDDPILGAVDAGRIALLGHSLGGAACLRVAQARRDAGRPVQGVVNLDGVALLRAARTDFDAGAPLALFHSHLTRLGSIVVDNQGMNTGWLRFGGGTGEVFECTRASHMALTDLAFNTATQLLGVLGDVDGPRFGAWMHAATGAFLDRHLRDRDGPSPRFEGVVHQSFEQ